MLKYILGAFTSMFAFLGLGATFVLEATDVTAIGSGATDTANSLVGIIGDLLPILIPLLVVGFAISLVM
jgi:hypothetical protein